MNVIDWQHALNPKLLHQVRVNRTRRQRAWKNEYGIETPNTALDLQMERLMPILKAPLHANTRESWIQVSKIMPFCMRSKAFTDYEFAQRSSVENEEAEREAEMNGGNRDTVQLADPMQNFKDTKSHRAKTI